MKDRRQDCYFLLQAIGELSEETVSEAKRGRVFPLRRIAIAAAAIIVIAGLLTGVIYVGLTDIPTATVTLDLSYGVTLRLNRDNKIVACNASTPQSAQKVKDLGLMRTEAPEAIGKIVGSMIDDGDLNSYDNTLLLTSSGFLNFHLLECYFF